MIYIILILMLLFDSLFIALGVWFIHNANELIKRCTLKIIGQVIDYNKEQRYDNDSGRGHYYYVYKPIVKCYIDGNEIIKELTSGQCSSNSEYPSEICQIGKKVEIFFNPDNYDEFYTAGDKSLKSIGIVFVCIGIFAMLFIVAFFGIPLLFNDVFVNFITR